MIRRARALLGAMALLLAAATPPARAEPCAAEHTDALRPITGHVWVWPGVSADTGPDNAGHVLSTTILHLGHALWVVDPGPSLRFGQGLRAALACRWQQRPSALLLTHAHADNTLAASAFRTEIGDGSIALLATPDTRERMRARCPDCLKSLGERLGATLMQGTDYVLPTGTLDEARRRELARRGWQVMTFTDAHTEHDLALWHPTSRTLIAGGLLYGRHLPELAQGSLLGWLHALDRLDALRPRVIVAHEVHVLDDPEAEDPRRSTRAYLEALRDAVWQAMDTGLPATQAEGLELQAFADWAGYGPRQGFNAQRAWRELEPRWMSGAARPGSLPDVSR